MRCLTSDLEKQESFLLRLKIERRGLENDLNKWFSQWENERILTDSSFTLQRFAHTTRSRTEHIGGCSYE